MNAQASSSSSGPTPDGSPAGSAGTSSGGSGLPPGTAFFDRIREFGIIRPDEGRWAAGVCAGLARRWDLDPLLVRGLFVVAGIISGFGLGLYGLLWLFLPHPDGRIHAQQVMRGVVTSGFVGAVLCLIIDLPFGHGSWGWNRPGHPLGGLTFLVLMGLGIWWLLKGRHGGWSHGPGPVPPPAGPGVPAYGTPAPEAPRPGGPETETSHYGGPPTSYGYAPTGSGYGPGYQAPVAKSTAVAPQPRPVDVRKPLHALTLGTFGVALVAAGGVLTWNRMLGHIDDAGFVATAVALGVVALGIITAGLVGRRPGGLAPIAVILAFVAANGAAWQGRVDGIHQVTWTPTTVSAAATGYNLGTGEATLDLTRIDAPTTPAPGGTPLTVPASIGAGELKVIVPSGVTTEVNASVGLGGITNRLANREETGGPDVARTVVSGTGPARIVVKARVGLGHIEVVPQGTGVSR